MADSSTNKTRVEEYGVRSVKGRWSEWSMDGNGLDCETKEQTSGLSMEDLAWLIEPHRDALFPAETAKAEAQPAGQLHAAIKVLSAAREVLAELPHNKAWSEAEHSLSASMADYLMDWPPPERDR